MRTKLLILFLCVGVAGSAFGAGANEQWSAPLKRISGDFISGAKSMPGIFDDIGLKLNSAAGKYAKGVSRDFVSGIEDATNPINSQVDEIFADFGRGISGIAGIGGTGIKTSQRYLTDVGRDFISGIEEVANLINRQADKIFADFGQGINGLTEIAGAGLETSYRAVASVGDFFDNLGKGIISIPGKIAEGAKGAVEVVKKPIERITKRLTTKKPAVKQPTTPQAAKEIKKQIEALKSQNTALKEKIERLEKQGVPAKEIVKEVSKTVRLQPIKKIIPIKEITKEKIVEKIPSEELAKIKKELRSFSTWGTDIENLREITKKLQANPVNTAVATAPIYIGS